MLARRAAPAMRSMAGAVRCITSSSGKATWDGPRPEGWPLHVKTIASLQRNHIDRIMEVAKDMKANPMKYSKALSQKTLLMLFEKPSLRTRVSLETGMTQLGGHAIHYSLADSPLGKKESIQDTAKVVSRYVDAITMRVKSRQAVDEMASNANVPVINALDDFAHPCQMLADLLTIHEHKGKHKGLKMAFVGDCQNNMTYDLMRLASLMGFHINVAGPQTRDFEVEWSVVKECNELVKKEGGGSFDIGNDRDAAIKDADIVYCDSWMSYGVPADERMERLKALMPFQVNGKVMALAKSDAIFMNCLPAMRGEEQTAEVIDGPQSVVWDQAENRLHAQKALLVCLINGFGWKP